MYYIYVSNLHQRPYTMGGLEALKEYLKRESKEVKQPIEGLYTSIIKVERPEKPLDLSAKMRGKPIIGSEDMPLHHPDPEDLTRALKVLKRAPRKLNGNIKYIPESNTLKLESPTDILSVKGNRLVVNRGAAPTIGSLYKLVNAINKKMDKVDQMRSSGIKSKKLANAQEAIQRLVANLNNLLASSQELDKSTVQVLLEGFVTLYKEQFDINPAHLSDEETVKLVELASTRNTRVKEYLASLNERLLPGERMGEAELEEAAERLVNAFNRYSNTSLDGLAKNHDIFYAWRLLRDVDNWRKAWADKASKGRIINYQLVIPSNKNVYQIAEVKNNGLCLGDDIPSMAKEDVMVALLFNPYTKKPEITITMYVDTDKRLLSILAIEPSRYVIARHTDEQIKALVYDTVVNLKHFADRKGYKLLLNDFEIVSNKDVVNDVFKDPNLFQYGATHQYTNPKEFRPPGEEFKFTQGKEIIIVK